MTSKFTFRCRSCDDEHEGIPTFGDDAPDAWFALPEEEREARAELGSDQCIIDGSQFFVRGCLEIPVAGYKDAFQWGVWVSVSEKSFARMSELWEKEGRERDPSYFGWLNTPIPGYPETLNLKTRVHTRPIGLRPLIELEPTNHPLAIEQRQGISAARLIEIVERTLHPRPGEPCRTVLRAHVDGWGDADASIVFDESTRPPDSSPPLAWTHVWIWRAGEDDDLTSFVTSGMSARALPSDAAHRTELHLGVRGKLSVEDERLVAAFLANLACYPWSVDRALDFWHTVGTELPIPRFPSCNAALFRPAFVDGCLNRVSTAQGEVRMLHVVPITAEERDWAKRDLAGLLRHWDEEGVDVLADRRPV